MKELHMITFALVIIGSLNWGLVGLLDFNLVETLLGSFPALVKIVYLLVGLSALYEAMKHMEYCRICKKKS